MVIIEELICIVVFDALGTIVVMVDGTEVDLA